MKELDVRLRLVAEALMNDLDSPLSRSTKQLIREKDWWAIARQRCDPHSYSDTPEGENNFRRDYQAVEFLRKSPLLPLNGITKQKDAIATFHECETSCAETNYFLELVDELTTYVGSDVRRVVDDPLVNRVVSILDKARKICTRILGKLPDDIHCRFGPGTSLELKGSPYATVFDKLTVVPTTTSACRPLFEWSY